MTLFRFGGKFISKGVNLGTSEDCCCDSSPPDEPDPPPSGPLCPCARFLDCTVTITYEGATIVALHKNLDANIPGTFQRANDRARDAGSIAFKIGPNNVSATLIQSLIPIPNKVCTTTPLTISGNCSTDNTSALWHLLIRHGAEFFFNRQHRLTYYRYNVDADPAQACPESVMGLDVTVSVVARVPGAGAFFLRNTPLPNCTLSCNQLTEDWIMPSPPSPASYYTPNPVWRRPIGLPFAERQPIPEGKQWICDLPIWGDSTPRVSVVCPP
jgi:hypothetical protein